MYSNNIIEVIYLIKGLEFNVFLTKLITKNFLLSGLFYFIFSYLMLKIIMRLPFTKSFTNYNSKGGPFGVLRLLFLSFVCSLILGTKGNIKVADFNKNNWTRNKNLNQKKSKLNESFQVSIILSGVIKSVEAIKYILVDQIEKNFLTGESFSKKPNLKYKSFLYSSIANIKDPIIQKIYTEYQRECIIPLLTNLEKQDDKSKIIRNKLLNNPLMKYPYLDRIMSKIKTKNNLSCSDLRNNTYRKILNYIKVDSKELTGMILKNIPSFKTRAEAENYTFSQILKKYSLTNFENEDAIFEKEATLEGTSGFFQSLTGLFTLKSWGLGGTGTAVATANKFNEMIKKIPSIQGSLKAGLLMIYPFIPYFVIIYGLKIMFYWAFAYFLISMWTPAFSILYSIHHSFLTDHQYIKQVSEFSDGISTYAANGIESKYLYSYSSFYTIQFALIAASLFSYYKVVGMTLLNENSSDSLPNEGAGDISGKIKNSAVSKGTGGIL